jgi:hypothetical protein
MSDAVHEDCPYFIHSSLRLFAMVHKPLDAPSVSPGGTYCGNMQLLCQRARNLPQISTYLSPLDAVMGSASLCEGDHYWPIDFRCVDTREFMELNGCLSVSVSYAYAAIHGRLVVDDDGHPFMVYTGNTFNVPRDQSDHFSIRFSERVVRQIEDTYLRAGLPNFTETLEAMHEWSSRLPKSMSWRLGECPGRCTLTSLKRKR